MISGYYLRLDGMGVSNPPGAILRFLGEAVEATGLTVVAGTIHPTQAFVIIAESHIAVTLVGDRAVLNVFSCAPFNWAAVLRVARDIFGGEWSSKYFRRSVPPGESDSEE